MSKEIDRLQSAFQKQEQVQPEPDAKVAAISAAFEAFEQRKISANSQGMEDEMRLREQGGKNPTLSKWRRMMNSINSKWTYSLAGSASVAVLAVMLVGPNITDLLPGEQLTVAELEAPLSDSTDTRAASEIGEASANAEAQPVPKKPVLAEPMEQDDLGLQKTAKETAVVVEAERDQRPVLLERPESTESETATFIDSTSRRARQAIKELAEERGVSEEELLQILSNTKPDSTSLSMHSEELSKALEKKAVNAGNKMEEAAAQSSPKSNRIAIIIGSQNSVSKQNQEAAGGKKKSDVKSYLSSSGISKLSQVVVPVPADQVAPQYEDQGRDKFEEIETSPVKLVAEEPVSTFSADVDTASYAFMRASLNNNVLPQKDAVRVEELINYFDYDYEGPAGKTEPFKANVSVMPTPWNEGTKLISIGIKGYELPKADQPPANLVFLIDTSGSMNAPNKLPLLRNSFKLLLSTLSPTDTISIVTYAGRAGTVLEPTKVADKNKILAALDNLHAGGSTAGGEGIRQAYTLAESSMIEDGVNRVILATDGDFNVGISNTNELKSFIERKRKTGVTLSVLGFGRGNYNDELMQALAQNGNGNAGYIDTLSEARKVLVEEAGSTLFTIAKDVKLQVEFNPAMVGEYRLIGYETRALKREDFKNDKVDAGDIGAGHTVTALYEITPANSNARLVDELRYGDSQSQEPKQERFAGSEEYGYLKIRYKLPEENKSRLIEQPISIDDEFAELSEAPQEDRFAAGVAAFGQILRGGKYTGDYTFDDVIELAGSSRGNDGFGYRSEFVNLARLAKSAAALQSQK